MGREFYSLRRWFGEEEVVMLVTRIYVAGLQVARHVDRPPSTGITAPVT
jgi:hypothetical protein